MKRIANKSREILKKIIKNKIIKIRNKKKYLQYCDENHDKILEQQTTKMDEYRISQLSNKIDIKKLFNTGSEDSDDEDEERFLEKLSTEEMEQIVQELNKTSLNEDWISNANQKIGMEKAAAIGKKLLQNFQDNDINYCQELSLSNLSYANVNHTKQVNLQKHSTKKIKKCETNKLKLGKY